MPRFLLATCWPCWNPVFLAGTSDLAEVTLSGAYASIVPSFTIIRYFRYFNMDYIHIEISEQAH